MKRLFITLLIFVFATGIKAQTIESIFTSMPDQIIPQLETEWRKDLIDVYKSGKEARLKNTMNGFSTLEKLTADYVKVKVTDRSYIEMKLLPLVNNTKVICVISTFYGPAPDSNVSFYSSDWKLLNSKDIFTPVSAEWFIKDDVDKNSIKFMEASSNLDINLFFYALSPDDQTLTETYSTPAYLSKEVRDKVMPYLKGSKVYTWKQSHFE